MTSVKNPLAYKNKKAFRKCVVQTWREKPRPGNTCFQNIAVREGNREGEIGVWNGFYKSPQSAKVREGKREAGNVHVKSSQSAKVREGSAKKHAKVISSLSCMFLLRFWSNYKDGTMSMLYAFPSKPASQAAACLACHALTACPCKQQPWITKMG